MAHSPGAGNERSVSESAAWEEGCILKARNNELL